MPNPPQTPQTTLPEAEQIYANLLEQVRSGIAPEALQNTAIVGIHSGGVWVAQRLHHDLALPGRVGSLDISFYRDDFGRIGLHPQVKPSDIPFDVAGASILLVDDILFTGRTIRGAMNVLFDYGRPARIDLAVLIDRGGRELPVEARFVGACIELPPGQGFVLTREVDAAEGGEGSKRGSEMGEGTDPDGAVARFNLGIEQHSGI